MKVVGHCSISGEPCFEVHSTWPDNHPFAGEPRRIGSPHKDALRLTLVLVDGSLMNVTIKAQELADFYSNLTGLWHSIKERMRRERKAHVALRQGDFDEDQHRFMDEDNLRFNDNVPLGILCWQRWTDING